jgi:chromosome segregation ATPase
MLTIADAQTTGTYGDVTATQTMLMEVSAALSTIQQLINSTETQVNQVDVDGLNKEVLNTNKEVSADLPKEYNEGANEFNQIALSAIFNNKQVNNLGARVNSLRDHAETHTSKVSFLSQQVSTTMANLQNSEEHFNFQISYLTDAMTDMNTWYNRAMIVNQRQKSAIDYTGSLLNHLETTLTQTCDMMRGLVAMLDDDAAKQRLLGEIDNINSADQEAEIAATDNGSATQIGSGVASPEPSPTPSL